MDNKDNMATVSGVLTGLKEDHTVLGERFYVGEIRCARLSGYNDMIPVTIPERILGTMKPEEIVGPIYVKGQIRSYNKIVDGTSRLCMTMFVQDFKVMADGVPQNNVVIEAVVCKAPNYRVTPFGREICDLMVVVNRRQGKSDYIPCIVWGRNSRWASNLVPGDRVVINGRFQSRDYDKLLDNGEVEKRTAHEVSVFSIVRAMEETA